jgi:hypothetical protein
MSEDILEKDGVNGCIEVLKDPQNRSALAIKNRGGAVPVRYVGRTKDSLIVVESLRLIKKFTRLLCHSELYREIEVELKKITKSGDAKHYRYFVKPVQVCELEHLRSTPRYKTEGSVYQLRNITYARIFEQPSKIVATKEFKDLTDELLVKVDSYSFVRFFPMGMMSAPAEVAFTMLTGTTFFMKDLSSYEIFFNKNALFFEQFPELRNRLYHRIKTLRLRYKSLLVMPVEYENIVGHQFSIGYLVVGKEKSELTNDDVLNIDGRIVELLAELKQRLRVSAKSGGKVCNISPAGIKLYFPESMYDELQDKKLLSIVLRIVGYADMTLAGEVKHIQKTSKGIYMGIQFQYSPLGKRFEKMLYDIIKDHGLKEV